MEEPKSERLLEYRRNLAKSYENYVLFFNGGDEEYLLEALTFLLPVIDFIFRSYHFHKKYLVEFHEDDSKQEASLALFEYLREKKFPLDLENYSKSCVRKMKDMFYATRMKVMKKHFLPEEYEAFHSFSSPSFEAEHYEFLCLLPEKIIDKAIWIYNKRKHKTYKKAVEDVIFRIVLKRRISRYLVGFFGVPQCDRKFVLDIALISVRRAILDIKKDYEEYIFIESERVQNLGRIQDWARTAIGTGQLTLN